MGSPRGQVHHARCVVAHLAGFSFGPDTVVLAVDRLREALADQDPIVRAGAIYGLAEAGELRPDTLERIAALKADPDEVVREAATYAHSHLASLLKGSKEKP